jgi:hypothetical protein
MIKSISFSYSFVITCLLTNSGCGVTILLTGFLILFNWPYSHFFSKVDYLMLQIRREHIGQKIITEGIIKKNGIKDFIITIMFYIYTGRPKIMYTHFSRQSIYLIMYW